MEILLTDLNRQSSTDSFSLQQLSSSRDSHVSPSQRLLSQHLSSGDEHVTIAGRVRNSHVPPLQGLLAQQSSLSEEFVTTPATLRDLHETSGALAWPQELWHELPPSQQVEAELTSVELGGLPLSSSVQLHVV